MANLLYEESIDEFINEIINQIEEKNKNEERVGDIIESYGYLLHRRKFDTFKAKIKDPKLEKEQGLTHVTYYKQNGTTFDGKKMILHILLESKRCIGHELAYVRTQAVEILEFSTGFQKFFGENHMIKRLFDKSIVENVDNDGKDKYDIELKMFHKKAKCRMKSRIRRAEYHE